MTIESILPMPDLFSAKRILGIQPHHDDNDIAATGILTQLTKNGAELFYLTATDDPMGVVTYKGHRDHIQTGLAAEAVTFTGLTKISSSDPEIDAKYEPHSIDGIALYFTREPNYVADISNTWKHKISAVRCYKAQFDTQGMEQLVMALDIKSQQVAQEQSFSPGEPLKVLHTSALHCRF